MNEVGHPVAVAVLNEVVLVHPVAVVVASVVHSNKVSQVSFSDS